MAPSPDILSYEQRTHVQRRLWRRRVFICASAIFAGLLLYEKGPGEWHEIANRFAYRQCTQMVIAPDRIVYDDDPLEARKLLAKPDYSQAFGSRTIMAPKSSSLMAAIYSPEPLKHLSAYKQVGAVFCHERTKPGGTTGLVVITASSYSSAGSKNTTAFHSVTIEGGCVTSWNPKFRSEFPFCVSVDLVVHPTDHIEIDDGQADSMDASHFTLQYKINNQPGTVDGWVTDSEGDFKPLEPNVDLKFRNGPATRRLTFWSTAYH